MTVNQSPGNVRDAALDVLIKISKDQAYSHLLLNETVMKKKIKEVDVALLTEIVYGTLQHQRRLDYYVSAFSKKELNKLENWVLILLRLSVYQMHFLDRVPDHAILNEAVRIASKRGHKGIAGMVNGILRSVQREGVPDLEEIEDPKERLAIETSHPDWLIQRWISHYGFETAHRIAHGNLSYPVSSARVNRMKVTREELMHEWTEEGLQITASPYLEEAVRVDKGVISRTAAFREGRCSIQDEGSMMVTGLLDPKPGMRVLDSCAAPGGKTSHIAERMNDEGELYAMDIHKHKIKLIDAQAERLGLSVVHGLKGDARLAGEQLEEESFDCILVDAPCSGLGVIQRKPDLKWTKSERDIERLTVIQGEILKQVWPLLKPGGRLVYSTCTIDYEENEGQVTHFVNETADADFEADFLNRLPEPVQTSSFANQSGIQLIPGQYGTDGFFMTSIVKRDHRK
ncbi:16S rRNA (cytosine(967)-C(5))-methyltransferase RsmB [Salisediminibacterium selenitireducens]|uniref:16S rRNA (cytosine(967)-C(5))-methyltransferase n=1 Tax=Bacillus selenitireducens (strain ATCC 700615 / DSM 15326 / MLS10) TaxID=439292 RepID=D6XTR5_BACIE|nr:16S rRNA (cytosine(967)-C(5))-methyltransferase RsmB [Salisediminibacterium selenitireducens]ADH99201.1 sun protein [[Bacillus] selenitireducens MLS10]